LLEEKNRAETEKVYYERNLAAARDKRDQTRQALQNLERKLAKLLQEDKQRSIIRRLLDTQSKLAQQKANEIGAEITRLRRGKVFRFDGREFDTEGLVRYCETEGRLRAIGIESIEKELKVRSALDARAAREREAAERRQRQEERRKQQAALAAVRLEKQRELAESVKRKLSRDHPCPYCGQGLGTSPHADHIYPVSRGGLSVISNMVFVCQICNQKK
jgi:5-methylcytosine-specific restriction endonuclease McrA